MDAKDVRCSKCNDERIVWTKGKYGNVKSEYCPKCNKEGKTVQKEIDKQVNSNDRTNSIEQKREQSKY